MLKGEFYGQDQLYKNKHVIALVQHDFGVECY